MTYGHRPVMLDEVARIIDAGPGAVYVDATVGLGGHAERLAEMAGPSGRVLGLDRDPAALRAAGERLARFGERVTLVHSRFSRLAEAVREAGLGPWGGEWGAEPESGRPGWSPVTGRPVNGILLDLGVSSAQLDVADRGFSFHGSAPLDMRMDPESGGPTAADLLESLPEDELARVFREYGEERWASRIASFVVRARVRARLRTAEDLVRVVKAAVPAAARREGPHPARRVFQALRIAVNGELAELERVLEQVPEVLAPGGRVVVISYHSLEDRLVKTRFRQAETGCRCPPGLPECRCGGRPTMTVLTRKPIVPSNQEVAENPRARSAKLRAAERLEGGQRVGGERLARGSRPWRR